jgi:hypothetical protein
MRDLPRLFVVSCEPLPPCSRIQPQPSTREPMLRRSGEGWKSSSVRKQHRRAHGGTSCFGWAGRPRRSSNLRLRPLQRATGLIMPSDLAERFVEGSRSSGPTELDLASPAQSSYRAIADGGGASGAVVTAGAPGLTVAGGPIGVVAAGGPFGVADAVAGALPGNTTTRVPTFTRV